MIMIEPPMASPDENARFYNAYALSTGQIFPRNSDGVLTHRIPKAYVEFISEYNSRYSEKLGEKESFQEMYYNSWLPAGTAESIDITYWTIDTNPVGSAIPAIGMTIFRVLGSCHQTVANLLMAGKIANLVVYIAICFYAIKAIPRYKRTLFLLALMPMTLYQAASINYDAILFASCFALASFVLSVLERGDEQKISKRDILIVLGITVVLSGVKQVYACLLLLLFAIPINSFKSKKQYISCICGVIITACIICIGQKVGIFLLGANATAEETAMQQQLHYIVTHPWRVPSIIWNSFIRNGSFYSVSFFGCLGQLDTNFPMPFILFQSATMFFIVVCDWIESRSSSLKVSLYGLLGAAMSVVLSFVAVYVIWTSHKQGVGVDWVDGIQGRYFIPVVPFVVISIPAVKRMKLREAVIERRESFDTFACVTGALNAAATFLILLLRFKV